MSDRPELRIVGTGQAPAYDSREEWLAAGARFIEARSTASWDFADWLKAGVDTWGEDAARDAAQASGKLPGKISNNRSAATAYPPFRRRNTLVFSHHLGVARLEPDEADDRILARAKPDGQSVREMREAPCGARKASRNSPGKIGNYRSVATRYPPVRRRTRLTISHHLDIVRRRRENAALRRRLKGKMIGPRALANQARDILRGANSLAAAPTPTPRPPAWWRRASELNRGA